MSISRTLSTINDFPIYDKSLGFKQKLEYIIDNKPVNIDSDSFSSKENKTELVNKLTEI